MRLASVTLAQSQILSRVGWIVRVDDAGSVTRLEVREASEDGFEVFPLLAPSEKAGVAQVCERAVKALRAGLVPQERRA